MSAQNVASVRDSTHECPREGCARRVSRHQLACRAHWSRVTQATQREVYAAYRSGDLVRHSAAMDAAIEEMNR